PEHGTRGAVEVGDRHRVAAIHHVEDEPATGAAAIDGDENRGVRRELDAAGGVAWRQPDVGDALVGRMLRIDREVEPALQLLVGSHAAEGVAVGEGTAQADVESSDGHQGPESTAVSISRHCDLPAARDTAGGGDP